MPLETLQKGILWGLKENVIFQFLFPEFELPKEYLELIDSVYHSSIIPYGNNFEWLNAKSDVVVLSNLKEWNRETSIKNSTIVVRESFASLIDNVKLVKDLLAAYGKVTIIPTNIEGYSDHLNEKYNDFLNTLSEYIKEEYRKSHIVQCNLITDRIYLDKMNNCNAGVDSITLCPDGKFYVCPAFYLDSDGYSIGDPDSGLKINNSQLYKLEFAPICSSCDCWQCKRCVWLNRKLTLEVNTPSHQQCVISHLERNASRKFLSSVRLIGRFMPETEIREINYLDPIVNVKKKL